MKKLAGILLLLCCFNAGWAVAETATDAVAASELQKAFRENKEAMERRYADRQVVVRGIAAYVGPDRFGLPSVDLSDSAEGTLYVKCVLPFDDFFKLGEIEKGQEVTLKGNYRAFSSEGMIVLKQCEILK